MRISRVRTKATVYQSAIEQDFWRGRIYDNVKDTADLHLDLAKAEAPSRTGALRNSMDVWLTPHGRLQWRYTIRINVDYGEYTLRPTGPIIWPTKSVWLWIRPMPYSRYRQRFPRMFVRGYHSENWLAESTTDTFIAANLL